MQKRTYHIDFSKRCGKIKPMHGINLSFSHNTLGENPVDRILAAHTPPIVGLHDVEHPYGQNQYIDIHCIFPDFSRDTNDETAYNFAPTDAYISKLRAAGAEVIFRLGESTDAYAVKPLLNPPRDVEKWADVCLHIIMHFNAKWANGYKWNIKYFEIWSGADCQNGFGGDVNDYSELYIATVRKIKEVFPKIKLGGYSSLGFSAMNRVTDNVEAKSAYPFMRKFLASLSSSDKSATIDFFTWRLLASSPEELSLHSKYAKSLLKEFGLRSCKSIVSEFEISSRTEILAADYLAAMITAHKSDIDMMLYKYSAPSEEKELADAVYSAAYASGDSVSVSEDYRKELYALAAMGAERGVVALSSSEFCGAVEIFVGGVDFSAFDITELSKREDGAYSRAQLADVAIKQNRIVFAAKKKALYILTLK